MTHLSRTYLSIVLVLHLQPDPWIGQLDRLIFDMDLWLGRHYILVVGH